MLVPFNDFAIWQWWVFPSKFRLNKEKNVSENVSIFFVSSEHTLSFKNAGAKQIFVSKDLRSVIMPWIWLIFVAKRFKSPYNYNSHQKVLLVIDLWIDNHVNKLHSMCKSNRKPAKSRTFDRHPMYFVWTVWLILALNGQFHWVAAQNWFRVST